MQWQVWALVPDGFNFLSWAYYFQPACLESCLKSLTFSVFSSVKRRHYIYRTRLSRSFKESCVSRLIAPPGSHHLQRFLSLLPEPGPGPGMGGAKTPETWPHSQLQWQVLGHFSLPPTVRVISIMKHSHLSNTLSHNHTMREMKPCQHANGKTMAEGHADKKW